MVYFQYHDGYTVSLILLQYIWITLDPENFDREKYIYIYIYLHFETLSAY